MADHDQILNLLDSLPIPGMELGIKVLVFSFLLAVILAIIFAWLTTRNKTPTVTSTSPTHGRTTVLNLTHPKDKIVKLQSELIGVEHAKKFLKDAEADELISSSGMLKIQKYYDAEIAIIESKLKELGYSGSIPRTTEVDELEDITKDLESRLTTEDDFYTSSSTSSSPAAVAPVVPTVPEVAAPPVGATPIPSVPVPVSKVSPPATKTNIPSPAKPSVPTPVKPTPVTAKPNIPAPVKAPQSNIPAPTKPTVPKPVAPSKPAIAKPRVPTTPVAPVAPKVPEQEEGDKFAKSTSIAALRSDMLRELAKLKQYIDEGDN